MSHPIRRSIICQICNRARQTQSWFDICPKCARNLPKMRCGACNKQRFRIQPDSPICHGCSKKVSREKIPCVACSCIDYPFISDPLHCRKCHTKQAQRNWQKSLREKIICVSCGREKSRSKKSEMICYVCANKRRIGDVKCILPTCNKRMRNKRTQLCEKHHDDIRASKSLRKYLETFTSPFQQNQHYMAQLASAIDWEAVANGVVTINGWDCKRMRAFGRFLQKYELPEVLTWEVIEQALPRLGQPNAMKIGFIRSCLFELGELLAERRKMPDRKSYLHEKSLRRALDRSPAVFRSEVFGFQQWLLNGMVNPNVEEVQGALTIAHDTMRSRVNAVSRFLNFCVDHNTLSLAQIGPSLIAKYQQTMLWQLECKECHMRLPFQSPESVEKCANKKCDGISSYIRIRRLARASLSASITHLRTFFDWAELDGLVTSNPFASIVCGGSKAFTIRNERGEMIEIAAAIRRYDDSVVEKLCADIVVPDADPEEAMVLYFIIFHLLTNGDLRNLRIPSPARDGPQMSLTASQAKHFEYLDLPVCQLTRGKRSVTRKDTKITFHPKALPWLRPILERFYKKRASMVKVEHQQHFLVNERNARSNKPVTKTYVTDLVRRASRKVLGGAVTASELRNTSADIFMQRSKCRGAILTGMGYSAWAATRFNYLERFQLPINTTPRRGDLPTRATQ